MKIEDIIEKLKNNENLSNEEINELISELEKHCDKKDVYSILMTINNDIGLSYFDDNFYMSEGEIYEIPGPEPDDFFWDDENDKD